MPQKLHQPPRRVAARAARQLQRLLGRLIPAIQPNHVLDVALTLLVPESRFDCLIDSWYPLTYMLNSLNRGMGFADAYPFVLSTPAVEKLRMVHEISTAGDPERT